MKYHEENILNFLCLASSGLRILIHVHCGCPLHRILYNSNMFIFMGFWILKMLYSHNKVNLTLFIVALICIKASYKLFNLKIIS